VSARRDDAFARSGWQVENVSDAVEKGDAVFVKIIRLEDGKVSASMRLADQTSGKDLDPTNTQLRAFRSGGGFEKAPLTLDAVLNTVCARVCRAVSR
jgi:predicted RNA-binding protein with RPS1 domain